MSEWLFPDVRPFWADAAPTTHVLDEYTAEMRRRKETKMATKNNAATTTATTKETTMTETPKKMTKEEREAAKQERYAQHRAAHKATVDELLAKKLAPAFDNEPINFIAILEGERQGKKPNPLLSKYGKLRESAENELLWLRMACTMLGWTDNSFATTTQAAKYQGHLKDEDMQGWEIQAGDTYWFTVYPYSAFEWDTESGLPEYDEEAGAQRDARLAESRAKRAERKAREARKTATAARKAAPKAPATKVYKVTMPDGTVLEAPSIAELKELKEMFAA